MLLLRKRIVGLLVVSGSVGRVAILLCYFSIIKSTLLHAQSSDRILQEKIFTKYSSATNSISSGFYIISYPETACHDFTSFSIVRNIAPGIAIVQATDSSLLNKKQDCIEKIAAANNRWKFSASLEIEEAALESKKKSNQLFTISAGDIYSLLSTLQQKKIVVETVNIYRATNTAVIKCNTAVFFAAVLPESDLFFADLYHQPSVDLMVSGYYRNINKINEVDNYFPGANGNGITIGIKEKMMDDTDIDLQKRILSSTLASPQKEFHANVVATLAGGAGNSFYTGKGLASKCNFFPSSFSNLFPDSTALLIQKNVTVQNHAYGTVVQSFYGAEAVSYDVQTNQNKSLVHVFSSGNRGVESAASGIYANLPGYANLTGNFKMAKNVITVAAVDTGRNIASFSSSGPLFDGRLAPQITALGPNGTSEAAAIVSGAVAVLQQVYKDSNAQNTAPASLLKAILFTTADDIGNKGIDYKTGFGLLNMYSALHCLQKKQYDGSALAQSEVWTKSLSVPPNTANLKINLVWTDTAASINTNKALVNDVDLELVELNTGMVYYPWHLSLFPNKDSLNKLPIQKRDSLNTAEQISIELPAPGLYQIRINGKQIQTINKQTFHIAWSWDTLNNLRFTNPVHSSDIDKKENANLSVQWKVALADTNTTGTLSISFNNGISWQPIGTGIKIYKELFNWAIPDVTTGAQLRMETAFGIIYSERFVIAPLTKLNIDYRCSDSLRLSWPKHVAATSYKLYALGDTAFLKPVLVVADTFAVLKKNSFPENIYAVEPILAGGLTAARSVAIDVRYQGVDCFYKTLLAETRGDSIELNLALSFLEGISRLEFEKLTGAGNFMKSISKITALNGQFNYTVFDNSPSGGMNYYRVKLTLNGGVVYTYIVSVLHNGKKNLLLYPNPVTRGERLNFRIKEAVGNVTMLLTDMTGRILFKSPVPLAGGMKTNSLPPGIYFITLQNDAVTNMSTEKIIIQ